MRVESGGALAAASWMLALLSLSSHTLHRSRPLTLTLFLSFSFSLSLSLFAALQSRNDARVDDQVMKCTYVRTLVVAQRTVGMVPKHLANGSC